MPTEAIPEFVTNWAIAYVVSLLALAVLSYFGSKLVLAWLAGLERRMYAAEYVRPGEIGREESAELTLDEAHG
jgi:hypothetical protein